MVVASPSCVVQSVVASTVFGEIYSDNAGKTWHNSTGGGVSLSVRFLGQNGDGGMKYACSGTYFNDKLQQIQVGTRAPLTACVGLKGNPGCCRAVRLLSPALISRPGLPPPLAAPRVWASPWTVVRRSRRTTPTWTALPGSAPSPRTPRGMWRQVRRWAVLSVGALRAVRRAYHL